MASYSNLEDIKELLKYYKAVLNKINISNIESKILYLIYLGEFIVTYFFAKQNDNVYFTGAKWVSNTYYKNIVTLKMLLCISIQLVIFYLL